MDEYEWLAQQFDDRRLGLTAVAHRMLGSAAQAEEAVAEARSRIVRSDHETDHLTAWLTTIVTRVCVDVLRSRTRCDGAEPARHRPEGPGWIPEPRDEMAMADSIGLALLAALETLSAPERSVILLHGLFGLPIEEIAPMVGRTPTATGELADRARRRIGGGSVSVPDRQSARQRQIVDAFLLAARAGDLDALTALLHPHVVWRSESGPHGWGGSRTIGGAKAVARRALHGADPAARLHPVWVNGTPGAVAVRDGRPRSILSFWIAAGRIVEIEALSDPVRVERVTAALLDPS